jgi:methylenetetrahydrofolate reductase (NADPH)
MTAPDHALSAELTALLASASVEISSRGHQLQELRDNFHPGIDVTITFLPGDNYRRNVEMASALRRLQSGPAHRRPRNAVARNARRLSGAAAR